MLSVPLARETLPATPAVRDLMTSAVMSVDSGDSIEAVDADMKFARVRHMPVVDEDNRLVGLVSQRDLGRAIAVGDGQKPISTVLHKDCLVAQPGQSIVDAIPDMLENKISSLPVVDDAGKLVGILTESDFLFYVYKQATGRSYEPTWEDMIKPVW